MIRLRSLSLPAVTQQELERLQERIDILSEYTDKVSTSKALFEQHNKPGNVTFRAVKVALTEMCSGARRCSYCEDSCADEVEHIKPKDLFPEMTFVWENYVYACGPCNGPKNNKFAIFSLATGEFKDITRRRGQPIVAPEPGDSVLIDPRQEDPLVFIELDLVDTFYFLPTGPEGSREYQRADYTIKILRLNERDILPAAREEAYHSYKARLSEYITRRDSGAPQKQLEKLISALQKMGHPTVWAEMKRQQGLIPDLRELFVQAPEALDW